MLQTGDKAPEFTLPDQNGKNHKLSDYLGGWLLIYFYPKDNTPGCTTEACAIRDEMPQFEKLDCKVLGISADSARSHQKFAENYNLNFTILSDENKEVIQKYGVWQKKKFMGKEHMGIVRTSFLLNPEGKVAKVYDRVKPEIHAGEVLGDLKNLTKE